MEVHKKSAATPLDFYRQGKQFLKASWYCFGKKSTEKDEYEIIINNEFQQLPVPCVVNAAFSCEMFLKALLKKFNISYDPKKEGHNLYLLYKKLSDSTQKAIAEFCGNSKDIDEFQNILKRHAQDFTNIRYCIEHKGWTDMSPLTMIMLAENLSTITHHILSLDQQEKII